MAPDHDITESPRRPQTLGHVLRAAHRPRYAAGVRFFHLSNTKHEGVIPPAVGDSRHGAEDPRAVGKPVVWLSNEPMTRSDNPIYQYEVELDPADPLLHEDELFKQGTATVNAIFSTKSTLGWFFYEGSAPIAATQTWDADAGKYV